MRHRALGWGIAAGVAALVLAIIAALGGFGRGEVYLGRSVAVKEEIQTRYWDFAPRDAGVIGDAGTPRAIAISLNIRSKLDATHAGITQEALMIRLPDQSIVLGFSTCFPRSGDEEQGHFDPLVLTNSLCVFDFALNGVEWTASGPQPIQVLVLDQTEPMNDFERTGELEVQVPPVAHVDMTARWLVT